ncbi:MAG: IclR family transcriptional regulator C-terminal domain-containing protein [Catenulispora sp.]
MTHPTTEAEAPPEAVTPLVRGLATLRELTSAPGRESAADLVRSTGLARSTVDRILSTLTHLGYVRMAGRDPVPTPRLMELGNAYLAACRWPDLLGPPADALADELDESVSLAVPDLDGVRFVHQATRRRAMSVAFRVGDLLPAEAVAPGALFAAAWTEEDWARWRRRRRADPDNATFPALPSGTGNSGESFERRAAAARELGCSLDDQLVEPGLIAIALPVLDAARQRTCAVSVVSHTSRHSAESLRKLILPRLRAAVADMEKRLRAAPAMPEPCDTAAVPPRTRDAKQDLGPEFVESLARGLDVVTAFRRVGADVPLTTLAAATGLARATVRRSLITLRHLGYATAEDGSFALTPRVLDLGFARLSGLTLARIARPHLARLVEQVRDSASMAVLAGDDIQYVARVSTARVMRVDITVGTRLPAAATSMGRVLLADVRRDGYALVEDELEAGLRSIAVPVRDRAGTVASAINVSMHVQRMDTQEVLDTVLPALRAAAARIEEDFHVAARYAAIPIS